MNFRVSLSVSAKPAVILVEIALTVVPFGEHFHLKNIKSSRMQDVHYIDLLSFLSTCFVLFTLKSHIHTHTNPHGNTHMHMHAPIYNF